MQAKFAQKGFSSTASGKMNIKNTYNPKVLDLDDFDVQMFSPNFLQGKTLKRPFSQLEIHLQKTNPNGTQFQTPQPDSARFSASMEDKTRQKFYQPSETNSKPAENECYKYIHGDQLNIKPAYSQKVAAPTVKQEIQLNFKDKNSIISALLRKGQGRIDIPIQIKISQPSQSQQAQSRAGPAQTKLKSLFKKEVRFTDQQKTKKQKEKEARDEIDEDINEEIASQYQNQSFQKLSGAYESGIKQSIRESIGGSSGAIKQSIRESIRQSIKESFKESSMKQEIIPESMSFKQSRASAINEEIMESIRPIGESMKRQSIDEEIYDEDFEDASVSDELSKSKNSKLKKSKEEDKFQLSVSASKGFRTKTNSVMKSIKMAEQFSIQNLRKGSGDKIQDKMNKGDKMAEEILKERVHFEQLQNHITNILKPKPDSQRSQQNKKNLDLYYRFKIEVNRLIASETFASKLRKLTSFLNIGNAKHAEVNQLEDKLLKDVMDRIKDMRLGEVSQNDIANIKNQYDTKLETLLKDQQITLRVEMDRKLHEKDLELKKMIAELQQKFQQKSFVPTGSYQNQISQNKFSGDRVEVDSDFSIDSEDVSWKMDLWEVLPDYEKKKLYEKQGNQVAKMLTDAIFKDIKEQTLNRQQDISFEFPDEFNISSSFESSFPDFKKSKKPVQEADEMPMFKTAFNRAEIQKDFDLSKPSQKKSQIFPPLPTQKSKPIPQEIVFQNTFQNKTEIENDRRDTTAVSQVIQILSKYKNVYLRKKNDTIRKVIKTIQTKTKDSDPLISHLAELRIIPNKEIQEKDLPFVKAYEEDLINELVAIYNKNINRKTSTIEEEMKKMYDRIVVTSQVKSAEASVQLATQITVPESYIELKLKQEEKRLKDSVVMQIVDILASQFAKEMPRRKR